MNLKLYGIVLATVGQPGPYSRGPPVQVLLAMTATRRSESLGTSTPALKADDSPVKPLAVVGFQVVSSARSTASRTIADLMADVPIGEHFSIGAMGMGHEEPQAVRVILYYQVVLVPRMVQYTGFLH